MSTLCLFTLFLNFVLWQNVVLITNSCKYDFNLFPVIYFPVTMQISQATTEKGKKKINYKRLFIRSRTSQSDSIMSNKESLFLKKWKKLNLSDVVKMDRQDSVKERDRNKDRNGWHMARHFLIGRAVRLQLHGGDGGMRKDQDRKRKQQRGEITNPVSPRLDFRRRQTPFLCKITIQRGAGPAQRRWQPRGCEALARTSNATAVKRQCNHKLPKLLRKSSRWGAGERRFLPH